MNTYYPYCENYVYNWIVMYIWLISLKIKREKLFIKINYSGTFVTSWRTGMSLFQKKSFSIRRWL